MFLKVFVGGREMSAAYETSICRQRTRVWRLEHKMSAAINELPFALCITAP